MPSSALRRRREHVGVATWPLDTEDLEAAAGWLVEERNARWLDFGATTGALSPLALRILSQRPSNCIWVYGPTERRHPVGLVGLGNIRPRHATAEAWCVLGDKEFGPRDLTVRAVSCLLEHAFDALGLRCIYAWTVEINRGGRRIIERLGFREAGRMRASHRIGDSTFDRVWYDLLSDEYEGFSDTW